MVNAVTLVLKSDCGGHKNKKFYGLGERKAALFLTYPLLFSRMLQQAQSLCISSQQSCQQWLLQQILTAEDLVQNLYKLVLFLFSCTWITGACSDDNSISPRASLQQSDTEILKKSLKVGHTEFVIKYRALRGSQNTKRRENFQRKPEVINTVLLYCST